MEFALVFPILFLLITGFIDMGRAVFFYSSLSNAVREGTRYAIVHKDTIDDSAEADGFAELTQKVKDFSFGMSNPAITVTVVINEDENDDPESVTITASLMFTPITPGIKQIFGSKTGIPLTVESTMRLTAVAR